MYIITDECLACASLKECGTDIMKGSLMCVMLRTKNKQTKADMLSGMLKLAKEGKSGMSAKERRKT